jgi:hypothetical protein
MTKKTPKAKPAQLDPYVVSAVNLRKSYWELLRQVANAKGKARADASPTGKGGRRSISGVIASLIDANRKQLEKDSQDS